MLREEWLHKATDLLRPYFKDRGYEIPEKLRLSCGWPSTGGLRTKGRRLGECWDNTASIDGVHQIFISPYVSETPQVLGVLVHELLHSCLPKEAAHKKPFKEGMKALNLIGSATTTQVGDELKVFLSALNIEDYPNSRLDRVGEEKEKKQSTRMKKIVCVKNEEHPEKDIILRGSKEVLALGVPTCYCGKFFEIVEEDKEENE